MPESKNNASKFMAMKLIKYCGEIFEELFIFAERITVLIFFREIICFFSKDPNMLHTRYIKRQLVTTSNKFKKGNSTFFTRSYTLFFKADML